MAVRRIGRPKETVDPNRPDGRGVIFEFHADTIADLALLPTSERNYGSTCFVLATSQVYILGADGWKLI